MPNTHTLPKIMLVDDNELILEVAAQILECSGITKEQILACQDFASAVRSLEEHNKNIHVVITDGEYPDDKDGKDGGRALINYIKENKYSPTIFLVTGDLQEWRRKNPEILGARFYSKDELISVMHQAADILQCPPQRRAGPAPSNPVQFETYR